MFFQQLFCSSAADLFTMRVGRRALGAAEALLFLFYSALSLRLDLPLSTSPFLSLKGFCERAEMKG